MGKMLIAVLMGTALLLLSQFVFGSGVITRFWEVTSIVTSFGHTAALAGGDVNPEGDVFTVIKFIIEIFIYYLVSAVITFGFGLLMPGKKKEKTA